MHKIIFKQTAKVIATETAFIVYAILAVLAYLDYNKRLAEVSNHPVIPDSSPPAVCALRLDGLQECVSSKTH